MSPATMHLLDVTAAEAKRADHERIGTGHVILALTRLPHLPLGQRMVDLNFDAARAESLLREWSTRISRPFQSQISHLKPNERYSRTPRWLRRLLDPLRRSARLGTMAWNLYVHRSIAHPNFINNPYRMYRWLRHRHPVRRDPLAPVWVVSRYDDVLTLLRNGRFRKDPFATQRLPRAVQDQLSVPPEQLARASRENISMLFLDPPDHTRVRGLFARAFTPRSLEALRPRVQQITDRWLDKAHPRGTMDLITDLAYPLPVCVIAELLGFPPEDYQRLKEWSDAMATALGINPTVPEQIQAAAARDQVRVYFDEMVRQMRQRPADNLIGRLLVVSAEAGQEGLNPDELFSNSILLLAAGHETTTNLIGNGMLALLRNPEQMRDLAAHPELMDNAIEELLRFDSPVQWFSRVAGEDLAIGGQSIRRGDILLGSIGSANRDESQFANPDRLNLRRPEIRHLSFGSGIHFCLGAALARMEAGIALGTLLRRYGRWELAEGKLDYQRGVIFRGVKRLRLRFR